jgi:hypothetical protein
VEETSTSTAWQSWTTSTVLVTASYTVTSCAPAVTGCSVGELTSTIYETVTWCPVTASASLSGSSGTATLSATEHSSPTTSATGIYNTTSLSPSTSVPYTNATSTLAHSNSTSTSSLPKPTPTSGSTNQTYIRILINDAVYVVPSCQDGPGRSCLMSEYVALVKNKVAAAGDLRTRCNVTNTASPTVLKGASFFTNLADSWLAQVAP